MEPGGIKTECGVIAAENLKKTSGNGAYAEKTDKAADATNNMYVNGKLTDPMIIGKTIVKSVTVNKPQRRYVKGFGAAPALFIRKWFGDGAYEILVKTICNV